MDPRRGSLSPLLPPGNLRYVVIPSGRKHFFGEIYPRDYFRHTVKREFENGSYPCPQDIDAYLTRLYGDYRAVPAPEAQEKHVFFSFEL